MILLYVNRLFINIRSNKLMHICQYYTQLLRRTSHWWNVGILTSLWNIAIAVKKPKNPWFSIFSS